MKFDNAINSFRHNLDKLPVKPKPANNITMNDVQNSTLAEGSASLVGDFNLTATIMKLHLPQVAANLDSQEPVSVEVANNNPAAYDGWIIGGDGFLYPPDTALNQLPQYDEGGTPTFVVNGVRTSPKEANDNVTSADQAIGGQVYGIYNATEGVISDAAQTSNDANWVSDDNPAADSVANYIYNQITNGQPVNIIGWSQGAATTSQAIFDVRQQLIQEGYTPAEADQMLGLVTVETFGGVTENYPPGPTYIHYVNEGDVFPDFLGVGDGLGGDDNSTEIGGLPPNTTVIIWKDDGSLNPFNFDNHSFGYYLEKRNQINQGNTEGVETVTVTEESEEAKDIRIEIDSLAVMEKYGKYDENGDFYIDWVGVEAYLATLPPEEAEQIRNFIINFLEDLESLESGAF